jgi:carbon storage regulator
MLVLGRRIGEVIKITDDITITVVTIGKNTVRLGLEAPDDIPIYREEIWLKIKAEQDEEILDDYFNK